MDNRKASENFESFWSSLNITEDRSEENSDILDDFNFLMCVAFCVVAVISLSIFGIAALIRNDITYSLTLFGFALSTIIGYGAIWTSGVYSVAKHFTTLIMALLCIYLFYSGGTDGTGPIYYFVFPLVALFLQGKRIGTYSVLGLLFITVLFYKFRLFGLDITQYSYIFLTRILFVYIIVSLLSFIFSFFKDRAERELLFSRFDFEQRSIVDHQTGLANRNLLEKMLLLEFNRANQLFRPCCYLIMEIDIQSSNDYRYNKKYENYVLKSIVKIFNKVISPSAIPGRWGKYSFLIIFPECRKKEAKLSAEKLHEAFLDYHFVFNNLTLKINAFIDVEEIIESEFNELLKGIESKLYELKERDIFNLQLKNMPESVRYT